MMDRFLAILRLLHWRRGLRAGFAVGTAMLVCRLLHQPMGWAALGGFEAVIVDNGGPYRSRLYTITSVLLGGAICASIGILTPQNIIGATLISAAVCFAVTYARVASQPIANSAVVILVLYFAGFGVEDRTLSNALISTSAYVLGGMWAAVISLFLWPVDPFRPARLEVADCFDLLAGYTSTVPAAISEHASHDDDHEHAIDFKRQLRRKLESAHAALSSTAARAPARTVRARNLSVLLETADMLFALTIRLTEIAEALPAGPEASPNSTLQTIARWLSETEGVIATHLRLRPSDNAASFGPRGSHRLQYVIRAAEQLDARQPTGALDQHLLAGEREALQNIEIAFDALRAVWTGIDPRPGTRGESAPAQVIERSTPDWIDAIRQNWTTSSLMMRHALRITVVAAIDVLFIRAFNISHGYWLAMTSIIVLQPYGFGTVRRSYHRIVGTVGGGILAALLAALVHNQPGMMAVITVCAVLTLATYAVHYGWYSFFLTPTFVLLSLPYLRDWRFASIRVFTTFLGGIIAVAAMHLLWPQNLSTEFARLLARCCCTATAYLRAVLEFWNAPADRRRAAERTILATARRACGLSSQDAEEALDRVLLEPAFGSSFSPQIQSALTFTTYVRRFVACATTLVSIGTADPRTVSRLDALTQRLDTLGAELARESKTSACNTPIGNSETTYRGPMLVNPSSLAEQMLQRMERQTAVLERATDAILHNQPIHADQ
jgi:uncharacterized membrane protein YccC